MRRMRKIFGKNRGFTLLELMIAISIFSGLVILVVGSFASSVNYQTRVKVNREVSESARSAIDAMAREVNLSWNGPVSVNQTIPIKYPKQPPDQDEPVYNFAVLDNKNDNYVSDSVEGSNVLVVRDETNHCRRYFMNGSRLAVQIRDKKEGCLGGWGDIHYLTNDNVMIENLKFKNSSPNIKSSASAPSLEISFTLKNSSSFYGDDLTIEISPETTVTIRNIGREKLSNE